MFVSLFDIFSICVGPSSSHTTGPMRAAFAFGQELINEKVLDKVVTLYVDLFGSLAMTGIGHATDMAILMGIEGNTPEEIDPEYIEKRMEEIASTNSINIMGKTKIGFVKSKHMLFNKGRKLPFHSNAMRFRCYDKNGEELFSNVYYSVGGGFILSQDQISRAPVPDTSHMAATKGPTVPYLFSTAKQLMKHCEKDNKKIYEIIWENEKSLRGEEEIISGIHKIWDVMKQSIRRGCCREGILPGGLKLKRRAPAIFKALNENKKYEQDPSAIMDWISVFALAVNEENAAGGKIVKAPTNGSAGVVPAVIAYYEKFVKDASQEGIINFLLTASAIGTLFKLGASISGAEVGCQGEVGVACSMAAGGLVAAMGGTNIQIEKAAEIAMEHNLGMTCDPIAGLVQIPCIERNTMGAIQAVNAARLAMHGDEPGRVSLDQVIITMRHTGEDMKDTYKETSEGGLALHVPVNLANC